MPSRPILDLAALAYEAATGTASWQAVAQATAQTLGGTACSLWVGEPGGEGGRVDLLCAADEPASSVRHRYGRDPWIQGFLAAAAAGATPDGTRPILIGPGALPDEAFRRSDFYAVFARHLGLSHLVANLAPSGPPGFTPIGIHRPAGAPPFGPAERDRLADILPHLRRALRLRDRIRDAAPAAHPVIAALEGLPIAALAVDAELRITRTNPAAEALLRAAKGLRLLRDAPPPSPTRLGATWPAETAALAALARAVAAGHSPGGTLRISAPDDPASPALAVLLTPLPGHLLAAPGTRTHLPGQALLVAREIGRPRPPSQRLLSDLFGLSNAEAEVATALAGGATAEAVAAQRGVGLNTVRAQIRNILGKTGAAGLRDLERLLATLATAEPDPGATRAPARGD